MRINSVVLKNIRSYTDTKVEFGNGVTLLSGDIGCGKSSILLAIDFALFGLRPGAKTDDLPGAALLRHGANEGSVVLDFSIDGADVRIKRVLLRKNSAVAQSAGTITINGLRKESTATELKGAILNLLGYPEKLLKANKSLLFRYTVYTPQEQMKEILFEKEEDRLDTLRNVFGMDKYRRIAGNASFFALELRRAKSRLEGIFSDLEKKQSELKEANQELEELDKNIEAAKKGLSKIENLCSSKKEESLAIKKKIDDMQAVKSAVDVKKNTIQMLEKRSASIKGEMKLISEALLKTDERELEEKVLRIKKELLDAPAKKDELAKKEDEARELEGRIRETQTRRKTAEETIEKIKTLDVCPTCNQDVDDAYKGKINEEEGRKIANFDRILAILKEGLSKTKQEASKLKAEIEDYSKKEKEALTAAHGLERASELKKNMAKKEDEHQKAIDEIQKELKEIARLSPSLKGFDEENKKSAKIDAELESLREAMTDARSAYAKLEQGAADTRKRIGALSKEVAAKTKAKNDSIEISSYENWISHAFAPLLGVIEKHVLAAIQQEFNSLFSSWFSVLVEDENLSCSIDDKFSPLVMQNGFEVSYNFLSGGEKTSIALAYRLALNKIINSLSETIRTKDLLILDEPTDGFSTEQLDRVRDVLDELKLKQILIVSHEAKMADFVDNVIRFRKQGHVSGVG